MKNLKVLGTIVSLVQLKDNHGNPMITERGTSHRLTIKANPKIDAVANECAKLTNRSGNPVTFALRMDNGDYLLDITPRQVARMCDNDGINVNIAPMVAKGAIVSLDIELRETGDKFIRRNGDGTEEVVEHNHAQVTRPAMTIQPDKLEMAMKVMVNATMNYTTPSVSVPMVDVDPVEEVV
jgi:hypothetical protein